MSYAGIGVVLALASSLTTAVAHALLKAGRDKLAVRAVIGMVGTIALAPVTLAVPLPTEELLPWLLVACTLHTTYQLVLVHVYETSDFTVAYPIARGIAPLATAIMGAALLGDRMTTPALLGIGGVSLGILLIAYGRSIAIAVLLAAVVAGILTTAYTVVDARAIRLAPSAMTFVAWYFVTDGLIMFPIFALRRRGRIVALLRSEGRQGLTAGLTSLASFGSALVALRLAPVGIVSALRETSVVFAMTIGGVMLHEHVDRTKMVAGAVIAAGAILILADAALVTH